MFKRGSTAAFDPDRLIAWRSDQLREAGFASRLAERLARDGRYDMHALLELTDRGCPAALAARILAPLESKSAPSR